MSLAPIPALFISHTSALTVNSGGVQICTREYINTLKAAGFSLSMVGFDSDQRILVRLKRRFWSRPYTNLLPPTLLDDVISRVENDGIKFIFFNLVDVAPLAESIRARIGEECKIILLSHGMESVDYLHEIRVNSGKKAFSRVTRSELCTLSQKLVAEARHRQYIDHVICLTSVEAEIERWLGAKNVTWLPRTIPDRCLRWTPHYSRIGFVGTVSHSPNAEGLILFLEELQKIAYPDVRLRLVGGPKSAVTAITKNFPMVEYLGQLSDEELEKEASTWSCFVHPIFCYARGCSTKLAVALGWQIPVVTTSAGCRGYTWSEGNLPLAETPESLAKLALQMLEPEVANSTKLEISTIVRSAPTLPDVAAKVQSALSLPARNTERTLVK